jgi:hypothetical protein
MPTIGRYEIESRIGRGGMGDVYRAYDPTLRRRVAVKVLKVEGDDQTLNRFRLEATAAGNLNHPNIVTVHDYGVFEGEPYLVMEYLEGEDLQRSIESGKKFDLVQIADTMSQVSDALECAHQHGVIHRDVKPANIMLLNKGGVKLMDFGIARLAGSNTQHTKVGHLIGTVLYMSPEQFHNLELDLRVDIWAYGVIYYELLAGKHPFQVQDQIVTMYNIANKPAPPICSINHEVPEALGQIVDRCLSKDRDQRYRTMEDLRFDAMPVLQDLSKQQAARMLSDACTMMEKAEWETAQALIRRVLELDPANRQAHHLRRAVADALKKRELGPRIETLSSTAEQQIAAKDYKKALESIEGALKLDSSQAALRQKAEEVKELIEREKRAAELLRAAKEDLETMNLTEAYRHAAEALSHDPSLLEGTRLLASVQEEINKRERQKVLQEGIAKARELLRSASFDEAVNVLKDLAAANPGSLEAVQLLREAEAAREEFRRRTRLQDELASVKELLRAQRFPEAVQRLEALTNEFPGQSEVQELLRYAREEWKVQQRASDLQRLREQIAKLQNDGRFEEALRFLERSKAEFPDEPDLARLAQSVTANKAEAERRAALNQALLDARGKQRVGEVTEALRLLDLGLREFGPDEQLNQLRDQLEVEWQKQQRDRAIQKAIADGRPFLDRREWEKAIAYFQNVARQYPDEAEPRKLLNEAEAWLKREQRQRAESEALARTAALESQGKQEAALAEVETSLKLYADSNALAQTKERLQRAIAEKQKTHEREIKLGEIRLKAQEEQKRRQQEAEQAAETQRRQLAEKLEEVLAKAYLAIGQGNLGKAAKSIAEARKLDANHPGVQRAQSDLDAEQARIRQKTAERVVAQAVPQAEERPKPFPAIPIIIGAGAALAVAAAVFFLIQPKPAPPLAPEPLQVTPQTVALFSKKGSGLPGSATIDIKGNPGANFAAKASDPWISIAPQQGTLPVQIAMKAMPAGLEAGPHTGSIEIVSGKSTGRVAVNFTITPGSSAPTTDAPKPDLKVIPETLSFNWEPGSPEPAPKTIYLSGAGEFEASVRNDTWTSVTPSEGQIPGQVKVTVHPSRLTAGSSGSHTNHVWITSPELPGVQKVVAVQLVIAEAPKPATQTPPVQTQIPTITITETKPVDGLFLGGRRSADLTWSGTLAPNETVTIGPGGVTHGEGRVVGASIPRGVPFTVSNVPAGVQAAAAVNSLTLTNVSGTPQSLITVHWAVK